MPGGERRILVIEDDRETAGQLAQSLAISRSMARKGCAGAAPPTML
jgi:hypothetical protein